MFFFTKKKKFPNGQPCRVDQNGQFSRNLKKKYQNSKISKSGFDSNRSSQSCPAQLWLLRTLWLLFSKACSSDIRMKIENVKLFEQTSKQERCRYDVQMRSSKTVQKQLWLLRKLYFVCFEPTQPISSWKNKNVQTLRTKNGAVTTSRRFK